MILLKKIYLLNLIMKLDIIKIFKTIIKDEFDDNYHTRKYTEEKYFQEIITFLRNETYWNRHNGDITGKVLNNKHNSYIKKGIYEKIYKYILNVYMSHNKTKKLKYQSTDTSFICNRQGYGVNVSRNKFYKGKRGIKICSIVDSNGVAIAIMISSGSTYDCKVVSELFDNMLIDTKSVLYSNHNRYKQYFLADSGFDSKEISTLLEEKGYDIIIPMNKRNTKDPKKIRKLTPEQKKIYKKRIIVENSYAWIKAYPVLNRMNQKTIKSYMGLLFLANSLILIKKVTTELSKTKL
jgi:hypothetical protein